MRARSAAAPTRRARPPRPTAAATCSVNVSSSPGRPPHVGVALGLIDLAAQVGDPAPVGVPGLGVDLLARVAEVDGRARAAGCTAGQVEHVNLPTGRLEQRRQHPDPAHVFQSEAPSRAGDGPLGAGPRQRERGRRGRGQDRRCRHGLSRSRGGEGALGARDHFGHAELGADGARRLERGARPCRAGQPLAQGQRSPCPVRRGVHAIGEKERPPAVRGALVGAAEGERQGAEHLRDGRPAGEGERTPGGVGVVVGREGGVERTVDLRDAGEDSRLGDRRPRHPRRHHVRGLERAERAECPLARDEPRPDHGRHPGAERGPVREWIEDPQRCRFLGAQLVGAAGDQQHRQPVDLEAAACVRVGHLGGERARLGDLRLAVGEAPVGHRAHRAEQRRLPQVAGVAYRLGERAARRDRGVGCGYVAALEVIAGEPGQRS